MADLVLDSRFPFRITFPEAVSSVANGQASVDLATAVSDEVSFTVPLTTLTGTPVYRFTPSVTGDIVRITSNLQGALLTGNATITTKVGATTVTGGLLTLIQAGSAAGNVLSVTPTAANSVVAHTSDVSFTVGGTNSASVGAVLTVVVRRTA